MNKYCHYIQDTKNLQSDLESIKEGVWLLKCNFNVLKVTRVVTHKIDH